MILASRSPQRRAILEQLGIPFSVRVPGVEELS
ncbi:MAG: Maf family protein, partial [Solirubrobacterales bacterium]|nr:Maf family protein [Solirubrobacterales bacterium]